jgi:UDP-glucuronate decarboxylase
MIRMMNQDNVIGPVNIGNPGEFTIKQLAEMVVQMTGSKSQIIYKELPSDDPRQRRPDITLARKALGWEPKIPLEKGLEKTIEYFKSNLE